MPGPTPSPNARRRNARLEWRRLPSSGRQGEPPEWPLTKPTQAEAALWQQLWSSPQAIAWESFGWDRAVARYARLAIRAEKRGALGIVLSEVRQLEDRLGLNPKAMKHLQWVIADDVGEERPSGPDNVTDLERYRERLG